MNNIGRKIYICLSVVTATTFLESTISQQVKYLYLAAIEKLILKLKYHFKRPTIAKITLKKKTKLDE